jgi:hypothetical protein
MRVLEVLGDDVLSVLKGLQPLPAFPLVAGLVCDGLEPLAAKPRVEP